MNLNQNFQHKLFLYGLFYILMIKTNYDHLEKLKRARSTRYIAALDLKYMK